MQKAADILDARTTLNPQATVLLLTDGADQYGIDEPVMRGLVASCASKPDWSTLGFGADHDAGKMELLARIGGGTFTYVAADYGSLASTLAAYNCHATDAIGTAARLSVNVAGGAAIVSIKGPGEVFYYKDGSGAEVVLGTARLADVRQVLIDVDVATLDDADRRLPLRTMTLSVSALCPVTNAAVTAEPVCIVAFTPSLRPSDHPGDVHAVVEAMAPAFNRELLADAAHAVAVRNSLVQPIVNAATSLLIGSIQTRKHAMKELQNLTSAKQDRTRPVEALIAVALQLAARSSAQQSLDTERGAKAAKKWARSSVQPPARHSYGGGQKICCTLCDS